MPSDRYKRLANSGGNLGDFRLIILRHGLYEDDLTVTSHMRPLDEVVKLRQGMKEQ